MNPTQKPESVVSVLAGGVSASALYRDGRMEEVIVRDLPLRELPAYLERVENESATVELFCGKEAGWADSLERESAEELLRIGEERNLDFLVRFARRAVERREKLIPGLGEALTRLAAGTQPSPA